MKDLEFPLQVYVDDEFRENYLKGSWNKRKNEVFSFDDKDYLVQKDNCQLGPEDMIKLRKMLEKKEAERMKAQDFIDWGRR